MNIFEIYMNLDLTTQALIAVAVVFLIIGLVKKVLWMCVIPLIVFAALFIMRPEVLNTAKEFIVEKTDSAVNPLGDETYDEEIDAID